MKVSGQAVLHAPIDRVWDALNDPGVLVRTIPGCERLEATGPSSYAMVVTAGVASMTGTYTGDVALRDQQVPTSFLMAASGAGAPGTVSTEVRVSLADAGDGSTSLSYDADAVVGGIVAGVGQRMLAAVAKKTAGEFFAAVDDVLTGRAPAPQRVGSAGAAGDAPAGSADGAAPRVFVAPPRPAAAGGFLRGLLAGAAVALAGVLVGGALAGSLGRRR